MGRQGSTVRDPNVARRNRPRPPAIAPQVDTLASGGGGPGAGRGLVAVGRFGGEAGRLTSHIARVQISGLITGDRGTLKLLKSIEDSNAAAVVVEVSSPGGTVTGSEHIYDALRRIAKKKPVVAVVDTMAASGGYIVALGADHIVADGNSLVGSIGVLFQFPNVSKLLDTIGVKVETIKSSPLKAAPNGLEPTSDAAKAAIDALVVDSFSWFKSLVKTRRNLNDSELAAVSDGRVFTGRQAKNLKLVDEFGGEREGVAWLESERGVVKGLPVREWKKDAVGKPFNLFSAARRHRRPARSGSDGRARVTC